MIALHPQSLRHGIWDEFVHFQACFDAAPLASLRFRDMTVRKRTPSDRARNR
jgi:hypothetical protein